MPAACCRVCSVAYCCLQHRIGYEEKTAYQKKAIVIKGITQRFLIVTATTEAFPEPASRGRQDTTTERSFHVRLIVVKWNHALCPRGRAEFISGLWEGGGCLTRPGCTDTRADPAAQPPTRNRQLGLFSRTNRPSLETAPLTISVMGPISEIVLFVGLGDGL